MSLIDMYVRDKCTGKIHKVGEWTPVSEELPDENIGVQATIEMPHGKLCVFEIWLQNGRWILPPRCREGKVIAWMPKPEPWEGEEE